MGLFLQLRVRPIAIALCLAGSLLLAPVAVAASARPALPTGKMAPTVIAQRPKPYWSWEVIPTSMHGADRDRKYNASEVARLAKYQMYTAEKWYTKCGSAGPTQSGPSCAIESVTEDLCAPGHHRRGTGPPGDVVPQSSNWR